MLSSHPQKVYAFCMFPNPLLKPLKQPNDILDSSISHLSQMRIKDLAADSNQDKTTDQFWLEPFPYLPKADAEQVTDDGKDKGNNTDNP